MPQPTPRTPPTDHAALLVAELTEHIAAALRRGWQPTDLVWVVERLHAPAVPVARLAVLAESASSTAGDRWVPPRWRRQLDSLAAEAVADLRRAGISPATAAAVAATARLDPPVDWPTACAALAVHDSRTAAATAVLLHLLPTLPPIGVVEPTPDAWPRLADAPGTSRSAVDSSVLERVRALLAKAESTTFEEEATAFTAKAQQLIARHAIDAALLAGGDGRADAGEAVVGRRFHVVDPYRRPKQLLLGGVATANCCTTVTYPQLGLVDGFGTARDLDAVELLFTSLLVQATNAMVGAGSRTDAAGRSRTRSFRSSFLTGYAVRIGDRLAAARDVAADEASAAAGSDLAPVLVSRLDAAQRHASDVHPDARRARPIGVGNAQGWAEGTSAADRADLGTGSAVGDAGRPAALGPP